MATNSNVRHTVLNNVEGVEEIIKGLQPVIAGPALPDCLSKLQNIRNAVGELEPTKENPEPKLVEDDDLGGAAFVQSDDGQDDENGQDEDSQSAENEGATPGKKKHKK